MNNEISVVSKDFNKIIEDFEKLKEVAVYLANSETFVKDFEVKDSSGKPIIDELTNKPKINTTDVALCLMAGYELGLNISGSLLYGKKLNQATYMAVMKGRGLGLDVATAIEKVVSIPTQNGYVSYTMVDIISAKLIQNGVEFLPFIKNYAPFYIYKGVNNEELDLDVILDENDNLKDDYALIDLTLGADKVKELVEAAKLANKIRVTRERHGYYSKAKFVRKFPNGNVLTHYQRFSSLDAERAGLLPTYVYDEKSKTYVEATKGKNNWISNTPQMMNNRVISIGGRIIGADLINGVYTREEVVSSGLVKENEAPIIDTTAEVIN
jgi:hypothetical protein